MYVCICICAFVYVYVSIYIDEIMMADYTMKDSI